MLELMLLMTNTTDLLLTQTVKYYLNPFPSLTVVTVLKPYFKELNPYQMILQK